MKLVAVDKQTGERRNVVAVFIVNDSSDMGDPSNIVAMSCIKLPSDTTDGTHWVYDDLSGLESEKLPFTLELI